MRGSIAIGGTLYGSGTGVVTGNARKAIVVGSGPNGLAAGIELARGGYGVQVFESAETAGGGLRSAELTLRGYVHDPCASILALLAGSPFLGSLPLSDFGLHLVQTDIAVAHPFDDGSAAVLYRSVAHTAQALGHDAEAYARLVQPLVARWRNLLAFALGPLSLPRHPLLAARFGLSGLLPATRLARLAFREPRTRALFGGLAAHSVLPLEMPLTSAFGLILTVLAHAVGFPVARGGSRQAASALIGYLQALGGEVHTGRRVSDLGDMPPHAVVLADLTPRGVLRLGGTRLTQPDREQLAGFRHGPGVYKVDWALDAPIPWTAEAGRRAMTVHAGGTLEDVARGERMAWTNENAHDPFVIVTQPSVVDPTRAPPGRHTAWAYCHVPSGSTTSMLGPIENQIERFAPGFRARIIGRATHTAAQMESYNPNYVGGDINGGAQDLRQLWTRPTRRLNPYRTSDPRLFVCSSSTPPGGGVHGMGGFYAARTALGARTNLIR